MTKTDLDQARLELSIKAKNGFDFITAAGIIWLIISYIWTLSYSAYDKSVLTFIVGGLMLPLAFLLSKVFKTQWKIKENPLQPLGLWLNLAQLFYFPFLVFILIKQPEYFVMTYVIITGAHFFPYAWFYNEIIYAIAAGLISIGGMTMGLIMPAEQIFLIPLTLAIFLAILAFLLFLSYRRKSKT